jgi:hypothetical protein
VGPNLLLFYFFKLSLSNLYIYIKHPLLFRSNTYDHTSLIKSNQILSQKNEAKYKHKGLIKTFATLPTI